MINLVIKFIVLIKCFVIFDCNFVLFLMIKCYFKFFIRFCVRMIIVVFRGYDGIIINSKNRMFIVFVR